MIRRYIVACILAMFFIMSTAGQSLGSLNNAEQAYQNNDFENAIQYFDLTISGGIYNGEIYYNFGTAHYQLGNIGNALLNYRRALQFLPRDLDLNIQIARTRALRNIPATDTTNPIILLEQMTETVVTISELAMVSFLLWSILWILIGIYQIRKAWRSTLRLIIGILLIFVLGFGTLLGARLYIHTSMPAAVITVGSAPIYSGPSISYFRQYDLFEGSEIYITDKQEEWSKFVTPDNREGWIETNNLTTLNPN